MALSDFVLNLYNQTPRGKANALKPGDVVLINGGTGITRNDAVSRRSRDFWEGSYGRVTSPQDFNGIVTVQVKSKTREFHYAYLEKVSCNHE
jgi:hypothetical protein